MLKILLTGAALSFALLLSPASSSAEPAPLNEPVAVQTTQKVHRDDNQARPHRARPHQRHHHHHHHHHR